MCMCGLLTLQTLFVSEVNCSGSLWCGKQQTEDKIFKAAVLCVHMPMYVPVCGMRCFVCGRGVARINTIKTAVILASKYQCMHMHALQHCGHHLLLVPDL